MAGIDKIYGTTEQYDEFMLWAIENRPEILIYFYPRDGYTTDYDRPITNLSQADDMWLLDHCPIRWVTDRIRDQYGLKKNVAGRKYKGRPVMRNYKKRKF